MWRQFDREFVDRMLETGPDSDMVLAAACSVPAEVDLWVGMASSVAIENHQDLPPSAGLLQRHAAASAHPDTVALRGVHRAWETLDADLPISMDALRVANRLVRGEGSGGWRTVNVRVGNLVCCPPELVGSLMETFVSRLGRSSDRPLAAWWAHLFVVAVHPWVDGNGRTARLLEAHLLRRGGHAAPWAATRGNWVNRSGYYRSIRGAENRSDPAMFYEHQNRMRKQVRAVEYDRFA